jgi:uncharacterized membrane protein
MPSLNSDTLQQKAASKLEAAPNRGKLILLFTGVSAGLSLAAGIISMILDTQIAGTGGLGGMQLRSVLSTVQALLNIALLVFIPFWNLGYISVALKFGRKEAATQKDLLNGFRRFGPALRLMFLRGMVNFAVTFAAMQVASILFSMTPWAQSFYLQVQAQNLLDISGGIDEAALASLTPFILPFLIIAGVLCLIALIPVTYRLRMAEYQIMDNPQCGALLAMLQSNRMMKGNCIALFKLDLRFWWYYLANILIFLLCYGDTLLPLAGISLPFAPEVSFILFYVLALGAQILLYWRCRNQVECTYVCAYNALNTAPVLPPEPPKNAPWNY